jgi:hypothetical protein
MIMRGFSFASLLPHIFLALAILLFPGPSSAQDRSPEGRSVFAAEFFVAAQPSSAFEMVELIPGFSFKERNSDIRGLAQSGGNVLVDGKRIMSKQDSLQALLERIPATQVLRVELIRSSDALVDMLGEPVLANVIRRSETAVSGAAEVSSEFYSRGFQAPGIKVSSTIQQPTREFSISGSMDRTVDNEHGKGSRPRFSSDRAIVSDNHLTQDEGDRAWQLVGSYQEAFQDITLQFNASRRSERFRAEILESQFYPTRASERVTEFEREQESELAGRLDLLLTARTAFNVTGLYRQTVEVGGEREAGEAETALALKDEKASESIVRSSVRHTRERITLEGGVEFAENILRSVNSLRVNGEGVNVPGASATVVELRTEPFASINWRANDVFSADAGVRLENSKLSLDERESRQFRFVKPHIHLEWTATPRTAFQLRAEMLVGQLAFEDFASSASLSTGTVTAGNADLEPDRTWRTEFSVRQTFAEEGTLAITARRDKISQVIDRIPIYGEEVFDSVGNIPEGRRNELQMEVTWPLGSGIWRDSTIKSILIWRRSRTTDPTTHVPREISEDRPWDGAVQIRKNLSDRNLHFGAEYTLPSVWREFRFDEIRTERLEAMLNAYVAWNPHPLWELRLDINNILDRAATRERLVFSAARDSGPVSYAELRTLQIGTYVGLQAKKSFNSR